MIRQTRQFRPTLYMLLAVGVTGYAIATQSPGLWGLTILAMALNAWLIHTGRFIPLPRLVATGITFLALVHAGLAIEADQTVAILTIGDFLVLLHLVKLYEQRANRDYAQLLVLSLLLMTAAAISTASLFFGLLLLIYLMISLYCCLLFHLKVESEAAEALLARAVPAACRPASSGGPAGMSPAAIRLHERALSASVRRLTGLVAAVSITSSVLIFLFFPRGAPAGFLGRQFFRPAVNLSGFSEQVSMDQVAAISQSQEVVAEVKVSDHGRQWEGEQTLLLRGATLDQYNGPRDLDGSSPQPWTWRRSRSIDFDSFHGSPGVETPITDSPNDDAPYVQEITLHPNDSHVLFAIAGPRYLLPSQDLTLNYWQRDAVLATRDASPLADGAVLDYTVRSSNVLPVIDADTVGARSYIDPALRDYARRPEVSGVDDRGRSLAALRGGPDAPPDVDHRIAVAIELHLRAQPFQYTLDLSPYAALHGEKDPLVVFLTEQRRGHCEYFAGAMTLMCQSLGIPARMVIGYRCDAFNKIGHFYLVQQNHAHAWVEVLTDQGNGKAWETFDPTSGNEAADAQATGLLAQVSSLFNYLEYRWGTAVIAYGQENRQSLLAAINQDASHAAAQFSRSLPDLPRWMSAAISSPTPISALVSLAVAGLIGAVGFYAYEQVRLRRRTTRIGLARLPVAEQRRLARQLGFYDDLLRLLEKRGIAPRPNLTPLEFSDQLAYLPHQLYHDIRRLTRVFYRIRYGQAALNARRRRRLDKAIAGIGRAAQALRRRKLTMRR